jgi:hypothetical protein
MIDQNDPKKSLSSPLGWAQTIYSAVGVIAGATCMIEGATLFQTDLSSPAYVMGSGPTPQLSCLPGTALFIAGVCLAYFTRPRRR